MVWRRGDECYAGRGVPEAGNHLCNFEAGQLSALTGLGALGHFDLDFAALVEIFRRNTKATGRDLFHGRVWIIAIRQRLVAGAVFTAFTGH